ncbi:MAG: hypothetical protein MSH49_03105 [[Eubacterium] saphenum]|nr:hypothetical protein [[Eubacterium] saphenum]
MKTIEQFFSEIETNDELFDKLITITNDEELETFLNENSVSGTTDEFKALVVANARGELTDEELEQVSGGADFLSSQFGKMLRYRRK